MLTLIIAAMLAATPRPEAPKPKPKKPGLLNARQMRAALVIAGPLARQALGPGQIPGDPVTLPDPASPLSIIWTSTNNSGSGKMTRVGANEWTYQVGDSYFLLQYATVSYVGGVPSTATVGLFLETPAGTLFSPIGFTTGTATGSPFSISFNATRAVRGFDSDLAVTITYP